MFRFAAFSALLVMAACSRPTEATNQTATAAPALVPPTADALAAKAVAARYFDLLRAGDYAGAAALWSPETSTATAGGAALAKAMRAIGRYDAQAGAPSIERVTGGERFVLVEAAARITPPGKSAVDQHGVVMLKRPVAGGDWRIWGVDVRPRRCRPGQTPRGLGCA